jgi:hypothetical protein
MYLRRWEFMSRGIPAEKLIVPGKKKCPGFAVNVKLVAFIAACEEGKDSSWSHARLKRNQIDNTTNTLPHFPIAPKIDSILAVS